MICPSYRLGLVQPLCDFIATELVLAGLLYQPLMSLIMSKIFETTTSMATGDAVLLINQLGILLPVSYQECIIPIV